MKPEKISDALNHLDEDLLREAEEARNHKVRRRPAWQKWGSLPCPGGVRGDPAAVLFREYCGRRIAIHHH